MGSTSSGYSEGEIVIASYRGRDVSARLGEFSDGQWDATVVSGVYIGDRFKLPEAMIVGEKLAAQVEEKVERVELDHLIVEGETTSGTPKFETKSPLEADDEPLT